MKKQFQLMSVRLLEPPALYLLPLVMVLFIGFLIWFLVPAPPKKIVMTTGADNGLYYRFGQQLAKELAKEKITLEVLPSAGSLENIERLNQPESKIHVGILQGGVGQVSENPNISALASVFDEQKTYDKLSKEIGNALMADAKRYMGEYHKDLKVPSFNGNTERNEIQLPIAIVVAKMPDGKINYTIHDHLFPEIVLD
uniref:hypothetical protein n=1 Tax=Polynucleobacter sp. TaxID=2029855 RepID=UPI004047B5C1